MVRLLDRTAILGFVCELSQHLYVFASPIDALLKSEWSFYDNGKNASMGGANQNVQNVIDYFLCYTRSVRAPGLIL